MKIEDEHFWPAERTRFWIYILISAGLTAMLAFGIYGWILYQQKVQDANMDSKQQGAAATVPLNNNDISSNGAQPSLAAATNSD